MKETDKIREREQKMDFEENDDLFDENGKGNDIMLRVLSRIQMAYQASSPSGIASSFNSQQVPEFIRCLQTFEEDPRSADVSQAENSDVIDSPENSNDWPYNESTIDREFSSNETEVGASSYHHHHHPRLVNLRTASIPPFLRPIEEEFPLDDDLVNHLKSQTSADSGAILKPNRDSDFLSSHPVPNRSFHFDDPNFQHSNQRAQLLGEASNVDSQESDDISVPRLDIEGRPAAGHLLQGPDTELRSGHDKTPPKVSCIVRPGDAASLHQDNPNVASVARHCFTPERSFLSVETTDSESTIEKHIGRTIRQISAAEDELSSNRTSLNGNPSCRCDTGFDPDSADSELCNYYKLVCVFLITLSTFVVCQTSMPPSCLVALVTLASFVSFPFIS